MITLITGTPGAGKTLRAVVMLAQEAKRGRRLLVDGIRDLAIDHLQVDEPWVREWHQHVQPNDLIVIDEVQRYWPPLSVSAKTPGDIEQLHVHRHKGVDFILITQHPHRLNKTVRDLIGRHIHVRRMFGMKRAIVYEWDHCHNPNAGFRDAIKTPWKYPRSVFGLYTSAEVHTKVRSKIPKPLLVGPIALVAAIGLAWWGFGKVGGKLPMADPGKGSHVGAAVTNASGGINGAASPGNSLPASVGWRVAGQYAVDDRGYVLLTDAAGHFRSEPGDNFRGETLRVEGVVDGQRVTVWSGGAAGGSVNVQPFGAHK